MLVFFSSAGHIVPYMGRAPKEDGDIKVRPLPFEKAAFIEASKAARQTLTQWMIVAGIEHAKRQGFDVTPPAPTKKKGGK